MDARGSEIYVGYIYKQLNSGKLLEAVKTGGRTVKMVERGSSGNCYQTTWNKRTFWNHFQEL